MWLKVEPAQGVTVAAIGLHLLPSLPASWPHTLMSDAAAFLRTMGAGVRMLVGNLNKSLGHEGGGLLSQAPGAKGPWVG